MGHASAVRGLDGDATRNFKKRGRAADQAGCRRAKGPSRKRCEARDRFESRRSAGPASGQEAVPARGGCLKLTTLCKTLQAVEPRTVARRYSVARKASIHNSAESAGHFVLITHRHRGGASCLLQFPTLLSAHVV